MSEKEKWVDVLSSSEVLNILEDDVITDISFVTQVCCTFFCSVIHQVKVGVTHLQVIFLYLLSVAEHIVFNCLNK